MQKEIFGIISGSLYGEIILSNVLINWMMKRLLGGRGRYGEASPAFSKFAVYEMTFEGSLTYALKRKKYQLIKNLSVGRKVIKSEQKLLRKGFESLVVAMVVFLL